MEQIKLQRDAMYGSLVLAGLALPGLLYGLWLNLGPAGEHNQGFDPFLGFMALVLLIGLIGYFDHRHELKGLITKEAPCEGPTQERAAS